MNAPVTLAIPVADPAQVTMTGLHDGAGGITVAVMSGSDRVPLPRMRVGQTVSIPVK